MNVWDALFTTQPTEPPQFDLLWYGSLFTLLALTVFLAYRYGEKKACQRFFQILQAVLDQSVPSVRKLAFLSLSLGYVCSAFDPGCL